MNDRSPSAALADDTHLLAAGVTFVRMTLLRYVAQQQRAQTDAAAAEIAATAAELERDAPLAESHWREAFARSPAAPLARLATACGLTRFECDVLLLALAYELDTGIHALCAAAQSAAQPYPTPALALAVFEGGAWDAFTPLRPLRDLGLVECSGGEGPWLLQRLRVPPRLVAYVTGLDYLEPALGQCLAAHDEERSALPASVEAWLARWEALVRQSHRCAVHLGGVDLATARELARAAARRFAVEAVEIDAATIPPLPAECDAFALAWRREALLTPRVLLLALHDDSPASQRTAAQCCARLIDAGVGPLLLCGVWSNLDTLPAVQSWELPALSTAEQRAAWEALAGPEHAALATHLATRFDLSWGALLGIGRNNASPPSDWPAQCHALSRRALDPLAQRIAAKATWEQLVLPPQPRELLRQMVGHVRWRQRVWEDWGFAAWTQRNLGVTAVFAGESGTGKTLAAEVLAGELELDLYRIDLSAVVSKYIGETEKNLRRIFAAAATGGALLLFDEADALFGRRSEVKDAHDRYANIEINFLLQQMDSFRGVAILATNQLDALDPAFLRRLRFVIRFPFPNAAERALIWQRVVPPQLPTAGLDFARLAALNLSGGSIHNIALQASFLAAAAGTPLSMVQMQAAAKAELAKLGRPLDEAVASLTLESAGG